MMRRYVGPGGATIGKRMPYSAADHVVHHVPNRNPLAGDFSGKQTVLDPYGRVFDELGGTIEVVEFHEPLASGDHPIALVKERALREER